MGAGTSASRTVPETLLQDEPVHIQDEFWNQLWNDPLVPFETVCKEMTPETMRDLKSKHPKNVATLIRRAVLKLDAGTQMKMDNPTTQIQVINAARVLTRLVPYVFEDAGWSEFWWTRTPVGVVVKMPPDLDAGSSDTAKQPKDDTNTEEEQEEDEDAATDQIEDEIEAHQPLAVTLLHAILRLLFAPGFTVTRPVKSGFFGASEAQAVKPIKNVDASQLTWYKGIDCEEDMYTTTQMITFRADLLRLLLCCISWPMYCQPDRFHPGDNRWLEALCSAETPNILVLFKSLVNIVLTFDPNASFFGVSYDQENMTMYSAQIMCILLEFIPLIQDPETQQVDGNPAGNAVRFFAQNMSAEKDFDFIMTNIARHLEDKKAMTATQRVPLHTELFSLFWKLCEINGRFRAHALKSLKLLPIITSMLLHCNRVKAQQGDAGMINVCVYTILMLSGERNFGIRLNHTLPPIPPTDDIKLATATHADLLVVAVHNLMLGSNWRLIGLYDCLMTILVNVSPYIRSLGLIPSNKLLHLFQVFSNRKYVLAGERNHHYVFFLLEAFNNMIQYQFDGNQHLVYCIIRRRQLFHELAQLKLEQPKVSESSNDDDIRIVDDASPTEPSVPAPPDLFSPTKDTSADAQSTKSKLKPMIQSTLPKETEEEHFTVSKNAVKPDNPDTVETSPRNPEFEPTKQWMASWHPRLPLETILRMLQILVPQVEKLCSENRITHEDEVIAFLKEGTLVGLLPVPHAILSRKYRPGNVSFYWYSAHIFGHVYVSNLILFHGSNVHLFHVKESPKK